MIFLFFILGLSAQVIIIDPGHGGENRGAFFKDTNEKDVVLSISRKIYKQLKKKYSVYLTRSIDRDLTLKERAEQALLLKADIFISVHANASMSVKASGFETFYLDNHDNAAIKKLEEKENKNSSGEEVIVNKILTDLVIKLTAPRSKKLAESLHSHIATNIKESFSIKDRGIRPALFYVLSLTKRPAVLLEVGFLSNPKELEKIKSEDFQNAYASGVSQGVIHYFKNHFKSKKPSLFFK